MFEINVIFVFKKLELFCLPFPQTACSSTAKVTDFKLTTGVPGSCQNNTAGSLKRKSSWCDVHLVTALREPSSYSTRYETEGKRAVLNTHTPRKGKLEF